MGYFEPRRAQRDGPENLECLNTRAFYANTQVQFAPGGECKSNQNYVLCFFSNLSPTPLVPGSHICVYSSAERCEARTTYGRSLWSSFCAQKTSSYTASSDAVLQIILRAVLRLNLHQHHM